MKNFEVKFTGQRREWLVQKIANFELIETNEIFRRVNFSYPSIISDHRNPAFLLNKNLWFLSGFKPKFLDTKKLGQSSQAQQAVRNPALQLPTSKRKF